LGEPASRHPLPIPPGTGQGLFQALPATPCANKLPSKLDPRKAGADTPRICSRIPPRRAAGGSAHARQDPDLSAGPTTPWACSPLGPPPSSGPQRDASDWP
jgi:hypothetical protein